MPFCLSSPASWVNPLTDGAPRKQRTRASVGSVWSSTGITVSHAVRTCCSDFTVSFSR